MKYKNKIAVTLCDGNVIICDRIVCSEFDTSLKNIYDNYHLYDCGERISSIKARDVIEVAAVHDTPLVITVVKNGTIYDFLSGDIDFINHRETPIISYKGYSGQVVNNVDRNDINSSFIIHNSDFRRQLSVDELEDQEYAEEFIKALKCTSSKQLGLVEQELYISMIESFFDYCIDESDSPKKSVSGLDSYYFSLYSELNISCFYLNKIIEFKTETKSRESSTRNFDIETTDFLSAKMHCSTMHLCDCFMDEILKCFPKEASITDIKKECDASPLKKHLVRYISVRMPRGTDWHSILPKVNLVHNLSENTWWNW